MCGIAGILGAADRSLMATISTALSHRGPDGEGFFIDKEIPVSLAHRRLSIIDLSDRGAQPMSDPSGRFVIIYNGEIYNYRELRAELEDIGHRFRSGSDTEVVLTSYLRWGTDCLARFRGMFAFTILDRGSRYGPDPAWGPGLSREANMFLARDRLGIKPLLYSSTSAGFLFASELKAILSAGLVEMILDRESLVHYLSFGSVLQPHTMIRDVKHLEPGCFMVVSNGGRNIRKTRYWNLKDASAPLREEYEKENYNGLVEETRRILEEATRYHLVSDVPVGAFLSGGVDSSAVVALMARHSTAPIKSFSLGFESNRYVADELAFARRTARSLGCEHHEVVVTARDISEIFDELITALDQPSIDGTNSFLVSRAAAEHVKVVLSGLGGDEMFAGYPHFSDICLSASSGDLAPLARLLARLHTMRPNRYTLPFYRRGSDLTGQLAGLRRIMFPPSVGRNLSRELTDTSLAEAADRDIAHLIFRELPTVAATSIFECGQYLVNTLLRDVDATSMAHSLEVRPVLLDHRLAEHAIALPDEAKIREGTGKAVLIDAVKDLVPSDVWRRPKMGFELPFRMWLQGPLKKRALGTFSSPHARRIFSSAFLRSQASKVEHGSADRYQWAWIVLLQWMETMDCSVD